MSTTNLLDELRLVDPATTETLEAMTTPEVLAATRASILAQPGSPATPARSHRGPARRRRRVVLATTAAVAATAAVVAAGVVERPGNVGGPTPASAADVLRAAGRTASQEADFTLTGDQRMYVAEVLRSQGTAALGQWWVDADGRYLTRTNALDERAERELALPLYGQPAPTDAAGRAAYEQHGDDAIAQPVDLPEIARTGTYTALRQVPTDEAGLAAYVNGVANRVRPVASSGNLTVTPEQARFATAIDLLAEPLAPPQLRSALFDYLAAVPGVVEHGSQADALGRVGVDLSYDTGEGLAGPGGTSFLVDTSTGVLLQTGSVDSYRNRPVGETGPTPDGTPPAGSWQNVHTYLGPIVVSAEGTVPPGIGLPKPDVATTD